AEIDCHEHCLTSWYLGLKERFNPAIDVMAVSAYATAVCADQLFRISLWATLLLSELLLAPASDGVARGALLMLHMGKHGISKQFGLPAAIVTPDFQHYVSATGLAVFFDALNAFLWRTRDRADFPKYLVSHHFCRGLASTLFHRLRDWP